MTTGIDAQASCDIEAKPFQPFVTAHPLDAICSCGHALWLHTTRCIARMATGRYQRHTIPCGCANSLAELTNAAPGGAE
jgi:hypothetical protein